MLRRLAIALLAPSFVLVAAPAYAAPPTTTTTTTKGATETFVDVLWACGDTENAPLYTITTRGNSVVHETVFPDGRVHTMFKDQGRFSAVPFRDANLPSYSGRFTIHGNFNEKKKTSNGTFMISIRAKGSDGSTLRVHHTEHTNTRPNGTINERLRCR
ncbi:hypothetical protein [Knoellia sinensis]|nr:hypothetical protein [Knoellia sinensis]